MIEYGMQLSHIVWLQIVSSSAGQSGCITLLESLIRATFR